MQSNALAEAGNNLAFKLLQFLPKDGNIFISPFSISTAMSMLSSGIHGNSLSELHCCMGLGSHEDANKKLIDGFASLGDCFKNDGAKEYLLMCANALVTRKGFPINQDYKDTLHKSFKAALHEVDFSQGSSEALAFINDWVKEKTNNMIPTLLDEMESDIVAVILNAIYFKGNWARQFDPQSTHPQVFYNRGVEDNAKEVDMMHLKADFQFTETDKFSALQLPYRGSDLFMAILIPRSLGGLPDLQQQITSSFLLDLWGQMRKTKVRVSIPKFKLEYSKELKSTFQAMGVTSIFDPSSDFQPICQSMDLYVSAIVHKAVIEVNEEGSEASAATAIKIAPRCAIFCPEFTVDRPFLFVIYDWKNDLVLFLGRVEEL